MEPDCSSEPKRENTESTKGICPSSSEEVDSISSTSGHYSSVAASVTRISLPLLSGSTEAQYRACRTEEATTLVWNCDRLKCDKPLQLTLPRSSKHSHTNEQTTALYCNRSSPVEVTDSSKHLCMSSKTKALSALIAAYSDDLEEQ